MKITSGVESYVTRLKVTSGVESYVTGWVYAIIHNNIWKALTLPVNEKRTLGRGQNDLINRTINILYRTRTQLISLETENIQFWMQVASVCAYLMPDGMLMRVYLLLRTLRLGGLSLGLVGGKIPGTLIN